MHQQNGSPGQATQQMVQVRNVDDLLPLHDQVILREITEDHTQGGIVIPRTEDSETACRGEVLAVGPGRASDVNQVRCPMSVKAGDTVYITPQQLFGSFTFLCGSETLHCVRDRELAIAVKRE